MIKSREIVFVDQNVSDLHSLLAGLRPDVEPIVLTASERATTQIATALKGRDDLHAVHIVAHGSAGEVRFGAGALSRETLHDHAADLAEIGRALGESGDLLLWSCNTAEGERGAAFVDELAHLVAANVAAASGLVGSQALGGRWDLDVRANVADARAPLTAEGMAAYQGVMTFDDEGIEDAAITSVTTDTGAANGPAGPYVTSDQTLTISGTVDTDDDGGILYIYLEGPGFSGGTNGQLVGQVAIAEGQTTWSFNLVTSSVVAAQNLAPGNYKIHIDNSNSASSNDFDIDELVIDTAAPTVTVNVVDVSLSDGDPSSNVTFTFNEVPVGFAAGDINAVGGTVSALTQDLVGDPSGKTYKATFTATDGFSGNGSVSVTAGGYTDTAGNSGAAGSDTVAIDRLNPSVTVNVVDSSLNDGDPSSNVTFVFSEVPFGFVAGDITAVGGTVSGLTQDLVGDPSGKTYKATFTATDGFSGVGSVSVPAASYTDAVGNTGTAGSDTVAIDTLNPTAAVDITAITDDTGTPGDFTTSDTVLKVSGTNGALGAGEKVQVSTDGVTWFDVTQDNGTNWHYDDPANHAANFTYQARVIDLAANVGGADTQDVIIDTEAPTATVDITAITDDTGTPGDFTTNDTVLKVSGTNGALGAGEKVQVSTDGATWFDVTQDDGTNWHYDDPANHAANFTYQARVIDLAANVGGADTQDVIIDTEAPTATVDITAITDDTGTPGDFTTNDTVLKVSGTNGALGAGEKVQVSNDGGATWFDVTQDDGTNWHYDDPANHAANFTYQARVIDLAANVGGADTQDVIIDTEAPTATVDITAITDDTGTPGDFTTNDTVLKVSGTNGALGAGEKVQVSTDGATWFDVTQDDGTNWHYDDPANHAANFTYQARVIDLAANVGGADTQDVIIDTEAPTATVDITAITDDTGTPGDFTTNDTVLKVSGTNGALGAGEKVQVSTDGGATWFDVTQDDGTNWHYDDPANHAANFTYQARVIDLAANVGGADTQDVIIDAEAPTATVDITAITDDTGTPGDFTTNDTVLKVSGTNGALGAGEKVQVSTDGATWFDVTQDDGTNWHYDDPANHAANFTYQARVIDLAANVGGADTQDVIIDTTPPDADDDATTVAEGGAVITVDVLVNDTDDNALTAASITAFSQGANGTVAYNDDGTFTYTHNGSETTADSFTYTIVDNVGNTDTATVDVTVTPVNDGPTLGNAIPDQLSDRQAFWQFQMPANTFADVDGPPLTYTATLGNGDPLPAWLTFNAATQTFSGTPPRDGALNQQIPLRVTASDGEFNVSDTFNLSLIGNQLNQDSSGFVFAPFQFTQAADTYTTSNQGEVANALGGADIVNGALGNDSINGNFGDDKIDGGAGQNILHGDEGDDYVSSTGNLNIAFGDRGADQLYFNGDQNQLFGGDTLFNDNDWLGVNGTNNALTGGFGDEVWIGASGNANTLNGDAGNDLVFANGIGNYLYGGIGADWLGVSGSFNVLQGQQGDDYVAATGNFNTLDGGAGNDTLLAGAHIGDRFVFHVGYGIDNIVNFAGHGAGGLDVIDLNGFGLNFTTLQPFMSDVGGNATITINAATILTIEGVTKAQLLDSDFLF